MQSIGIVRKIDELGRITLPMEIRRTFDIKEKDQVEIFTDGETICLKKYESDCRCGEADQKNLREWNGQYICKECIRKLYSSILTKE